ncbi:hypothetical protein ACQJBY_038062 [Aegilops geniculata]
MQSRGEGASSGRVVLCRLLSIREQSKSEGEPSVPIASYLPFHTIRPQQPSLFKIPASAAECPCVLVAGCSGSPSITKARCLWNCPPPLQGKATGKRESEERMGMPRGLSAYMVDMVWAVLAGWVSACLLVANEIARGMRAGEIGPFVVG